MADVATAARENALQVEAKKDGLRQTQDGLWKLTITVAPGDMPAAILAAPMGTRYVAVFVELNGDETPKVQSAADKQARAAEEKPRKRWADLPRSQQAAIRCQEPVFRDFLAHWGFHCQTPDDVADFVRGKCGVTSRRELDADEKAARTWDSIETQFQSWAGRVAEAR